MNITTVTHTDTSLDPLGANLKVSVTWLLGQAVLFLLCALIVLVSVNFNVQLIPSRSQIELGMVAIAAPITWFVYVWLLRQQYSRTLLRRRQLLSGEWREQAQDQPTVPVTMAPLPLTMRIRLNLGFLIPYVVIVIVLFAFLFVLLWQLYVLWAEIMSTLNYSDGYITSTATTNIPLDRWITCMFLLLALWMIWIALAIFIHMKVQRWLCPELEATEEGLTAIYPGDKRVSIRWNDVRYFAFSAKKKAAIPMKGIYELSDGENIIRWRQPYGIRRFFPLYVATVPRAQYNQQFATLLAFITIQTGQPLLDMQLV